MGSASNFWSTQSNSVPISTMMNLADLKENRSPTSLPSYGATSLQGFFRKAGFSVNVDNAIAEKEICVFGADEANYSDICRGIANLYNLNFKVSDDGAVSLSAKVAEPSLDLNSIPTGVQKIMPASLMRYALSHKTEEEEIHRRTFPKSRQKYDDQPKNSQFTFSQRSVRYLRAEAVRRLTNVDHMSLHISYLKLNELNLLGTIILTTFLQEIAPLTQSISSILSNFKEATVSYKTLIRNSGALLQIRIEVPNHRSASGSAFEYVIHDDL